MITDEMLIGKMIKTAWGYGVFPKGRVKTPNSTSTTVTIPTVENPNFKYQWELHPETGRWRKATSIPMDVFTGTPKGVFSTKERPTSLIEDIIGEENSPDNWAYDTAQNMYWKPPVQKQQTPTSTTAGDTDRDALVLKNQLRRLLKQRISASDEDLKNILYTPGTGRNWGTISIGDMEYTLPKTSTKNLIQAVTREKDIYDPTPEIEKAKQKVESLKNFQSLVNRMAEESKSMVAGTIGSDTGLLPGLTDDFGIPQYDIKQHGSQQDWFLKEFLPKYQKGIYEKNLKESASSGYIKDLMGNSYKYYDPNSLDDVLNFSDYYRGNYYKDMQGNNSSGGTSFADQIKQLLKEYGNE